MAQSRRGNARLNRTCFDFVMEAFPGLRHLGNFNYWSLHSFEIRTITAELRSSNRALTIDEDFKPTRDKATFEYKYVPGRHRYDVSTGRTKLKTSAHKSMSFINSFLGVMANPNNLLGNLGNLGGMGNGLFMEDDSDFDSDDDFGMDAPGNFENDGGELVPGSDSESEDSEDEDDDILNEFQDDDEQACAIM